MDAARVALMSAGKGRNGGCLEQCILLKQLGKNLSTSNRVPAVLQQGVLTALGEEELQ